MSTFKAFLEMMEYNAQWAMELIHKAVYTPEAVDDEYRFVILALLALAED
jgi:hypothetical protein